MKTGNNVDGITNFNVYPCEKKEGYFVLNLDGPLNTQASPILQKEVNRIFKSNPVIIILDMKQVNYINFRGLRVILKTIMEMNRRSRKVYLTNLQPQIKEMFEIMNGALPEWVFGSRRQLENYFDTYRHSCSITSQWTKSDAAITIYYLGAESNFNPGIEQSSTI